MIAENIARISASLPSGTRLVAVSKLKPVDDIMEAYNAGQRLFGENYATELRDKAAVLPQDIQWHFIGHLQSKQLKYYIPFVSMIHGVDSLEHLEDVEKAAAKVGRVVDVLLQVHVAQEETKFGFLPDEALDFLHDVVPRLSGDCGVSLRGIMAMASNTDDEARIRRDFRLAHDTFLQARTILQERAPAAASLFTECSMGMSDDWPIAVEEGATLIRIGSSIFGPRQY